MSKNSVLEELRVRRLAVIRRDLLKCMVSLDGVTSIRMVGVSASVNLSLHHEVQKFLFWHRLTRVVPE